MPRLILKAAKFINLANSLVWSYFGSRPSFVRILPTDRCNLNCEYCWQLDNNSPDMTIAEFKSYVAKAKALKVGMITFLGGEPMIWPPLYEAIAECSKHRILTDMTTNGTLLAKETITALGESGLDYLNISVDGFDKSSVTKKNSIFRDNLVGYLKEAKAKYRMHFRVNSVIYNNNFENIKLLIEFSKEHNMQISLGFIVPPTGEFEKSDQNIYFTKKDEDTLREIVSYILQKKRSGYPIIDPNSYFENVFRFINRDKFWDCNYPTRYGWINVTPSGRIRSCTKKMDELDYRFLELTPAKLKDIREIFKAKVRECNTDCYSNCAYDSYFYTHNKLHILKKLHVRLKHG